MNGISRYVLFFCASSNVRPSINTRSTHAFRRTDHVGVPRDVASFASAERNQFSPSRPPQQGLLLKRARSLAVRQCDSYDPTARALRSVRILVSVSDGHVSKTIRVTRDGSSHPRSRAHPCRPCTNTRAARRTTSAGDAIPPPPPPIRFGWKIK